MAAPLSYAFASFHAGDYDRYPEPLGRLRAFGFRWVTLIPSFVVREPFEIGLDYTPALATIRAVLAHALAIGFDVKLEPHVDWQTTLDAEGEWRGRMRFDPRSQYFERVVEPMRELSAEARALYPERRILLTLGSEVDRSVREFPDAWLSVLNGAAVAGIAVGHKLNHDVANDVFRSEYICRLNYVSFSFYPKIGFRRPREWWLIPQSDRELEALADALGKSAEALTAKLPPGVEFQVGEAGLGSGDVEHSYKLDPDFFKHMDEGRRQLRRNYYAGLLRFARRLPPAEPFTFWSAGYFDFLGVFDLRYKDDKLITLVEESNR